MAAPTVDQVISNCRISPDTCSFGVEGGTVYIAEAELRRALEAAYDPNMPEWLSMVSLDC